MGELHGYFKGMYFNSPFFELQQVLKQKGRSSGRPFCRRYPKRAPKPRGPRPIVTDVTAYQAMTDILAFGCLKSGNGRHELTV